MKTARGTVEGVKVTVLVEGVYHPSLKGAAAPGKTQPLQGLSLFVEVNAGETRRILMDTGTSWKRLKFNAEALGKDLQQVDCGFVTHWHFDHTGALPALVKHLRRRPPFYVPPREPSLCLINGLVELRLPPTFNRVEVKGPCEILPGVCSTGCLQGRMPIQRHPINEQALFMNVKGRGLVLLVGCSHPKPQDLARRALELSGENRIALMLGGFHFILPTKEQEKQEIIRELKALDIARLAACHCTGAAGVQRLQREFGGRFERVNLGGVYEVTSA